MKAEIKRLHSPDVSELHTWLPEDPACFGFLLQVMVGPAGGDGEESFDFLVCSPAWLRRKYGADAVVRGRHQLLLFSYDFDRLVSAVAKIVEEADGETWDEVASKISRYGGWEFEDFGK